MRVVSNSTDHGHVPVPLTDEINQNLLWLKVTKLNWLGNWNICLTSLLPGATIALEGKGFFVWYSVTVICKAKTVAETVPISAQC